MGSLDITFAKDQFIDLLSSVRSSQLPQFTIWMDQKLAEYKVFGKVPEKTPEQDYPHWIRQALQQHFKSFFGDTSAFEKEPEDPVEFPSPVAAVSQVNRKRTSNTEPSLSRKLPRLTEPPKVATAAALASSPEANSVARSRANDIASRLSGFPTNANSNTEQSVETEQIVIKDEELSEDEHSNDEPGFKIQLDSVQAIDNNVTLPPLSAAFAMQPSMVPMQFAHASLPPPFLRMPHPKPGSSSIEHNTPVISKTESQATPKSEQTNKTNEYRLRAFLSFLDKNGVSNVTDLPTPKLEELVTRFFRDCRKADGSFYTLRSYQMIKFMLDKWLIEHYDMPLTALVNAYNAYLNGIQFLRKQPPPLKSDKSKKSKVPLEVQLPEESSTSSSLSIDYDNASTSQNVIALSHQPSYPTVPQFPSDTPPQTSSTYCSVTNPTFVNVLDSVVATESQQQSTISQTSEPSAFT